jgi:3-oxoacyl-[acyl-carrier protein] reductase
MMSPKVLITGGTRGIGKAITARYVTAGYEVVTPDRATLDLSSETSIHHYFSTGLVDYDILINNAAENIIGTINELSEESWYRMQMVNLTAPFLLLRHTIDHMSNQKWGRVVNISSCYSLISKSGRAGYSATKSGLNALTRTAALEYACDNILVNAVAPGFIETDLTHKNNSADQIAALCQQIPLMRLGTPEEVADLVFFLGSAQNTYITGQLMVIDGGLMAQ